MEKMMMFGAGVYSLIHQNHNACPIAFSIAETRRVAIIACLTQLDSFQM